VKLKCVPTSADSPGLGEFELIRQFFATARCAQSSDGIELGIGDDCALLALPPGEQLAVSTDTLVAGVHFPAGADAFLLAQRGLAAAASDLAAMGAAPLGFTLALTLPAADPVWLKAFAQGLDCMAQICGLALVGGDTTRGPLSMTFTVMGCVPNGQALTRSGAQVGDLLCVGGSLGDAAAALPLVLAQATAEPEITQALLARYWTPEPQLALGLALRGKATAALDISDGLLADCAHMATASSVAVHIELNRLPIAHQALALLGEQRAQECALSGGDDYRLVFSLPVNELHSLQALWPQVAVIGRVMQGSGVQVCDASGLPLRLPASGYQHFGSAHG
jgi:thiamine-monophosphate kinase